MRGAGRAGRPLLRGLTALAWVVAFILTHIPPSQVPKTRVSDKFAHFVVYALLGSLLYLCLWTSKRSTGMITTIVIAAGLGYGAIDEWTQPLVGRFCSLDDWLADAGGTLCAAALFTIVRLISTRRTRQGFQVITDDPHN